MVIHYTATKKFHSDYLQKKLRERKIIKKLIKCTLEMTNIQSLKNLQEIVNFPTWILLKINI